LRVESQSTQPPSPTGITLEMANADSLPEHLPAGSPWPARRLHIRDRDTKRVAIIRAAAHAFSKHGFHNTSIDMIARALKVTKPTVYYYVANKEQLLFECFVAGLERIRSAMSRAGRPPELASERLQLVISNYAQAIASEYGWCMVRAEDQDLSPTMSAQIKALKSEIDQGIRRLLREGMRDGSIQRCDPKMTAFAIAGALNWIAHWYRQDQSMSPRQIAAAFSSIFYAGLLPRTAARKSRRSKAPAARK
jgi:AcrR family transcriptional regulator